MTIQLDIVVPCYNEEDVITETSRKVIELLDTLVIKELILPSSSVCFVDDGSEDQTWQLIEKMAHNEKRICGIKLSGNFGHQNALLAGMFNVDGDAVITVDADLQDDLSVIEKMVVLFRGGVDIVFGVRRSRNSDNVFKRHSAIAFYKILSFFGVKIIQNHADFRLLSQRVKNHLKEYSEINIFLRGIIPIMGFPSGIVYYDRLERFAGKSKYSLKRMISFALNGMTSFSVVPLRLISFLGFFVCALSLSMILWIIIGKLFLNSVLPGWASSTVAIYFLGGVQLLSIGVLGEYVAKIYLESKRRPRYLVETTLKHCSYEKKGQ